VVIHAIDIVSWQDADLVIDVRCSKGTYIRTLAEDIGETLGCGAHLSALRRTGSGPLTLAGTVTIAELEAMTETQREALLQPVDALLADWPVLRLDADDAGRFLSGLRRRLPAARGEADLPAVRVYGPEASAFLGSAHVSAGELIPDRLLSPVEVLSLHPPDRMPDSPSDGSPDSAPASPATASPPLLQAAA
jgi:tRNA pseudouridine55 synthase